MVLAECVGSEDQPDIAKRGDNMTSAPSSQLRCCCLERLGLQRV